MIVQNLDGWKLRRRKQSEEAIVRVSEIKRVADQEQENGGRRKSWVNYVDEDEEKNVDENEEDGEDEDKANQENWWRKHWDDVEDRDEEIGGMLRKSWVGKAEIVCHDRWWLAAAATAVAGESQSWETDDSFRPASIISLIGLS